MLQHLDEPISSEIEHVDENVGGARLSQRAYQAIRTSLRLGELKPGEKLILRPLAAGKATNDVIFELEAIAARFAEAAARDDRHEMTWQDDRFHREILLASHRTTLVKIVENLQVRTGPLIALCDRWSDDTRGETQARLIEALRDRDGAAARRAMTDGFEALFGQLRAAMERTRAPEAV